MASNSGIQWYFDDFAVGQVLQTGSRTVSEAEIIAFATQFDPQPFHVDHDAGAASIFGGVIASGWHTCSMMMRLVVDAFLSQSASMGSPGIEEIRWLKPVRAGDTISVQLTVQEVRPSRSKPDRGVILLLWEASNQHGEPVATIKGLGMFGCRPAPSSL
jgi:acyl dehydratase